MLRICALLLLTLASANLTPALGQAGSDEAQIRKLMRTTWERLDAPLAIDPVVVHGRYAIAGWSQEDRGGRALLRLGHGGCEVILCAGDHLRVADTLVAVGISSEEAGQLVARLLDAESRLPPERLSKLSLFDAILKFDGSTHKHGH